MTGDDLVFNLLLTTLTALKERKGDMAAKRVLWNAYLCIWCIYLRGNNKEFFCSFQCLETLEMSFSALKLRGMVGVRTVSLSLMCLGRGFDPSVLIFILKSRTENLNSSKVSYLIVWHERADPYLIWAKTFYTNHLNRTHICMKELFLLDEKAVFFSGMGCEIWSKFSVKFGRRRDRGNWCPLGSHTCSLGKKISCRTQTPNLYLTSSVKHKILWVLKSRPVHFM